MEKANVFSLIKKFEQLSTEMAKPKPVVVRQKSVKPIEKVEAESVMTTSAQAIIKNETKSWNNNPLMHVEERVRALKKTITNLPKDDKREKILLGLFMEMLDLLIQLSTVDTDGLKTMKQKKDSCLAELKILKMRLTEVILPESADANSAVLEIKDDENEENAATEEEGGGEIQERDEHIEEEEEEEEEIKSTDYDSDEGSDNRSALSFPGVKLGSVHSLTMKFENNQSNSDKVLQDDEKSPINTSVSTQMHDELIDTNDEDLNIIIEYYKNLIKELDPEDFVRIETVKEYLLQLNGVVENRPDVEQAIECLLHDIEILINTPNAKVVNDQSRAPLIIIEENLESFHDEETQNGFDNLSKQAAAADDNEASPQDGKTIEVLEINIPGENHLNIDNDLATSISVFGKYKQFITTILEGSEDIIEHETDIQTHYNAIMEFTPHQNIQSQFQELSNRYKELLDLITETNFAKAYQQAVNTTTTDENGAEKVEEVFDSVAYFNSLVTEIGNYQNLIETVNPADKVRVDVINEDLVEIVNEIEKCEFSMNQAMQSKKIQALKKLSELQIKLTEKCKTSA